MCSNLGESGLDLGLGSVDLEVFDRVKGGADSVEERGVPVTSETF